MLVSLGRVPVFGCCHFYKHKQRQRPSAIWMGRIIFVGFLCLVATGLGIGAYLLQVSSEKELAEIQYDAIIDRAFDLSRDILLRKMLGTITFTSLYSETFPNINEWPFVHF